MKAVVTGARAPAPLGTGAQLYGLDAVWHALPLLGGCQFGRRYRAHGRKVSRRGRHHRSPQETGNPRAAGTACPDMAKTVSQAEPDRIEMWRRL